MNKGRKEIEREGEELFQYATKNGIIELFSYLRHGKNVKYFHPENVCKDCYKAVQIPYTNRTSEPENIERTYASSPNYTT